MGAKNRECLVRCSDGQFDRLSQAGVSGIMIYAVDIVIIFKSQV